MVALIALLFAGAPGVGEAAPPPAPGDVFLGVRATADPGSGESYIVNLGNISVFAGATPNQVIPLNTLGDIGLDLTAKFGVNWHTRGDLLWGVFGSVNASNPVVFASRAQVPFGTPATLFPALNLAARGATNTRIVTVLDSYLLLPVTGNAPTGVFQPNNGVASSYATQVGTTGTTDFGSLSQWASIEGSFAGGAANTALDLFRFTGNPTDGDLVKSLGTFTINTSGNLTFTAGPEVDEVRVAAITKTVDEDDGAVQVDFTRSGDITGAVTATYQITDVSATAGTDYTAPTAPFEVAFPANVATASLVIPVANRAGFFGDRVFTVALVSATGGFTVTQPSTTTVAIKDIESDPGALRFTSATYSGTTADPFITVSLQRLFGASGSVTVDVSVSGGSLVNGTDFDYDSPTTVTFADGATTATTQIPIIGNTPGTIELSLGNPTGFSRLGSRTEATVSIAGAVGGLSFSQAQYFISEDVGVANIPIVRTGGALGAVSVNVSTTNGTAQAPADFTALSNVNVPFGDGVSTAPAQVTILNTIPNEPNESFTITLSSPTGGAVLGAIPTATVTILDQDAVAPKVTIAAPAANGRILEAAGPAIQVTGSATDNKGVERVEVRLNGAAPVEASLTLNAAGTSATYQLGITAVPGLNTIDVQSFDTRGNASSVVTRKFTYVLERLLTVSIDNTSPANSGTLTAPFPGTALREVGRAYTIVATARPGFVFDGWSGTGITGLAAELPSLNFVFTEGLVLTAKFIPNPFEAVAGEYNGLVQASGPTVRSNATDGHIKVTITKTGSFSGTLRTDGFSLPLSGVFDNTGVARFNTNRTTTGLVQRPGKPALELELTADLTPPLSKVITGAITQKYRTTVVATSTVEATLKAFDGKTPATSVPAGYLVNKGLYTAVLPSRASQGAGLTTADYPLGDGLGQFTVLKTGVVSFKGALADGTAITASGPLTADLELAFFAPLYPVAKIPGGSVLGGLAFDDTETDSDVSGTDFVWYRPYLDKVQHYPFGWPEGIDVDLLGAKYAVTPGTSVLQGLSAVNPASGNADLSFSDGLLASPVDKSVNVDSANKVANAPVTDKSFTLKITPANGEFSGTFTDDGGKKPAFRGVIIQKGAQAGGYGYFLSAPPAPKVIDGTGQGGAVTLSKKP